jgi:hypothetical protein
VGRVTVSLRRSMNEFMGLSSGIFYNTEGGKRVGSNGKWEQTGPLDLEERFA